jgi:hypothetical protein
LPCLGYCEVLPSLFSYADEKRIISKKAENVLRVYLLNAGKFEARPIGQ